MSALVSVLVPSYNHERFVLETLQAVSAQTYERLEAIVIDDGSKDGSPAIIERWAHAERARFARLEVRVRPNVGLQATLNEAVLAARGDYVLIIASDDVLEVDCVARLEAMLSAAGPDVAVASGNSCFIDGAGKRLYSEPSGAYVAEPTATSVGTVLERFRPGMDPSSFGTHASFLTGNYVPSANLIRRSSMLEAGLYGGSARIEDFDMWLKLSRRYRFAFTPDVLSRYRVHGENQSSVYRESMVRDTMDLIMREAKHLKAGETRDDVYRGAIQFLAEGHPRLLLHLLGHVNAEPKRILALVAEQTARKKADGIARRAKRLLGTLGLDPGKSPEGGGR